MALRRAGPEDVRPSGLQTAAPGEPVWAGEEGTGLGKLPGSWNDAARFSLQSWQGEPTTARWGARSGEEEN